MDDIGINAIREFLMSAGFNVTDSADIGNLDINGGVTAHHAAPILSGTRARPGCNISIKAGKACVLYIIERTVREAEFPEAEAQFKTKIVDLHSSDGLDKLKEALEEFIKLSGG